MFILMHSLVVLGVKQYFYHVVVCYPPWIFFFIIIIYYFLSWLDLNFPVYFILVHFMYFLT